jgi:hypothetical protein
MRSLRVAPILAALAVLAGALSPTAASAGGVPAQTFGSGAWIWFSDPRAVYYAGKHRRTYATWVNADGNAILASYDHDTRVISTIVLRYGVGHDDHANPTLLVLPRGRLIAFYSAHDGPGINYRVTKYPEDIASLEPEHQVPRSGEGRFGSTYPSPIRLSHERGIWLFWRGGNWQPTFATSATGRRWSRPRTLIQETIPHKRHRPYLKVDSNGVDTIHLAFTEAHPGRYPTGIYYAAYRDGLFLSASGQTIGSLTTLPLTADRADQVYDPKPKGLRAWVYDVAEDEHGRPVIVYDEIVSHTDHRYRYARWTGIGWQDNEIVPAGPPINHTPGWYSAGISLDHEDPTNVYLSRKVDGQYEIEHWQTLDGGATWRSTAITSHSAEANLRPVKPRGLPTDEEVFWMRGDYPDYRSFRTSIWTTAVPTG